MTPEQTEALYIVEAIEIDEVRSRAVMLVAANNIDGLKELRSEVSGMSPSGAAFQAWRRLHRAILVLEGV